MGPINAIQSSACGATASLTQMASALRGGEVGQGMSVQGGAQSSAATSISSMVSTMSQSVSQMIQSSGGSSSTEQLMRTLIAAIVLLALLDQSQRAGESMESAANMLASSGLGNSQGSESSSSFTFISYEQTSISMSYSVATDYAQMSTDGGSAQGGQLDVSA